MSKAAELANLIGNINAGGGGVNRNAIINGSMNVAQRGTSSTGIGASSGYFTCDRWLFGRDAGTEQARFTMTQDTASVGIDSLPFQEAGIRTALKMDVTTAESAVASGESSSIMQRIEGFNCSNFDIKTKPITLSFYAKSDAKTGTMCASLYASSGARHHVKEYSITTDWQRFSLTFPADSSATALANDNSNELQLSFVLTAGSDLQVTADQWASGFDSATSNQINFADSTDNNWYLTGVQLEVGQNATEFEREPFDVTLQKCHRYFFKNSSTIIRSTILRPDNIRNFDIGFPTMRASATATLGYSDDGTGVSVASQTVSADRYSGNTSASSSSNQDPRFTSFEVDAEL